MLSSVEVWKPVNGYEGIYEISSEGRFARIKNDERFIRKINLCTHYPSVSFLKRPTDKSQKSATIHKLVAEAFLGERPLGAVIRHIDGNRYNSKATNLCYGTPEENRIDSINHKTFKGSKNGNSLLCEKGVEAIRMLIEHGVSLSSIARRLDISTSTVHAIKTGRNWK
jgi:hypothetical protein